VVIVNAVVNTKIKFAPDERTAHKHLKVLAVRVLGMAAYAYLFVSLVLEVISPQPVTRRSVLFIAMDVAALTVGWPYSGL
jgi:hypothetical protein